MARKSHAAEERTMRPFDAAWSVLKQEIPDLSPQLQGLGVGAEKAVTRGPNPDLAYKRGTYNEGISPIAVAAGNALSQMGYPFLPETPMTALVPKASAVGVQRGEDGRGLGAKKRGIVTQPLVSLTLDKFRDAPSYRERQQALEEALNLREPVMPHIHPGSPPHSEDYKDFHRRQYAKRITDPLLSDVVGVADLHEGNIGFRDGKPYVIDFAAANLHAGHPIGSNYGQWWLNRAGSMRRLSPEQRRTFVDLYSDRSQFDPWNAISPETWSKENARDYGRYLNSIRALQFYNSLAEDPEQKRLFEFDPDAFGAGPDDLAQLHDYRKYAMTHPLWQPAE